MKRLILASGVLFGLYTILYFAIMNRSPAFSPVSIAAEYPSSFRWSGPVVAGLGKLFPASHWANRLFAPLDLVFRHDDLKRYAEDMSRLEQQGRCKCCYDPTPNHNE